MVREGRVLISSAGKPAFGGAGYYVTALPVGAQVASASAGDTVTVRAGHGFEANHKGIVFEEGAVTRYFQVGSVTSEELTLAGGQTLSVAEGEFLVNLGNDTGFTAPNYDGSTVEVFTDMDYSNAADLSTVQTTDTGRYIYWHQGVARWDLVRSDAETPYCLFTDTGEVFGSDEFGANVKSFGAIGDGVTDDTAAIIAAVASKSTADGVVVGGTIWFPAGEYIVSSMIEMPSGIVLRGESAQSTRITAASAFSDDAILRWKAQTGFTQNPGLGARDLYLDCNAVNAIGIHVYKGYDAVTFDTIMVDGIGLSTNGYRFEQDPDYGNSVSQTILLNNCYGIHTGTAGATGEVFYFNSVQEMTLVNCKGFGGYAVATGNCDVFHFDGCRGVTMIGGAAAISEGNGVKIKGTARASQGLAFYGVTFEAVGDAIDAEGNVFVVNYLTVSGARFQSGSVTPAVTTGGFNLQNVTYADISSSPGFELAVDANCNRVNFHTNDLANLTSDAGTGTKVYADYSLAMGATNTVMRQSIGLFPSNNTGPDVHFGHADHADYWRLFWSKAIAGTDNGFYLRYVDTGGTPYDIIHVDSTGTAIQIKPSGTTMATVDSAGITSAGQIRGLKGTAALTGSTAITTAGKFLIDITNTSGSNTFTLSAPSSVDGQILILRIAAITAGDLSLADSGNVSLSAAWTTPGVGDTLTLVASGVVWYEIARSNN